MIVNVNPYDTGFDENSHVMKFSALAKEVTTNVAPLHAKQNVAGTLADITGTPKKKRTVTIVTSPRGQAPQETLWEVAEEEEDKEGAETDREDDLVDRLFGVIEDLKARVQEELHSPKSYETDTDFGTSCLKLSFGMRWPRSKFDRR